MTDFVSITNNNGTPLVVSNAKTGFSLSYESTIVPTVMGFSIPALINIGGAADGSDIIFIDIPSNGIRYSCTGAQGITSNSQLVDDPIGYGMFRLSSSSASPAVPFKVFTPHSSNSTPVIRPVSHGMEVWDESGSLVFSSKHQYLDIKSAVQYTVAELGGVNLQPGTPKLITLPTIPVGDGRKYWVSANSLSRVFTYGASGRTDFFGTTIRKVSDNSFEVVGDYLCHSVLSQTVTPTNYLSTSHNVTLFFTLL